MMHEYLTLLWWMEFLVSRKASPVCFSRLVPEATSAQSTFFLSLSTGILSFFAVQAGAKKVYAIEASSMASHAEVCTVSGYQTCCCFKFICQYSESPIDCLLVFCYTKEYLVCQKLILLVNQSQLVTLITMDNIQFGCLLYC